MIFATFRSACLLFLGLGAISCCCPSSSSSGDAGTSSPSPAPPPVTVAPRAASTIQIGDGVDESLPWTSPEESFKAVPSWAIAGTYAPSLPEADLESLFQDYQAEGQILINCKVEYSGNPDSSILKALAFSEAPELEVSVKAGKMAQVRVSGPEDRHWVMVSIPLMSTERKETLLFHLWDRDELGGSDDLGSLTVLSKLPVNVKKGLTSIRCVGVPRDRVEEMVREALSKADLGIDNLIVNMALNERDASFGVVPFERKLLQELGRAAGWVGWADPRVKRRVDWADRAIAHLKAKRAEFLQEKLAQANSTVLLEARKYNKTELISAEMTCSKQAPLDHAKRGCVVRVEVDYKQGEPLDNEIESPFGWGPLISRQDGESYPLKFVKIDGKEAVESGGGKVLTEGKHGVVVFETSWEASKRPNLLSFHPTLPSSDVYMKIRQN